MHSHLNYSPLNGNSAKAICFIIFVVLLFATVLPPYSSEASIVSSNTTRSTLPTSAHSTPLKPPDAFGRLPLSFETNQGQTDSQVRFLARGQGYGLFLTTNGAVFSFNEPSTALRMRLQGA